MEEDGEVKIQKILWRVLFQRDSFSCCKVAVQVVEKSIQSPDSFAEYYKEQEKDKEDYEKRISDFISSDTVSLTGILGDMADYGWMNFASMSTYNISFWHTEKKRTPVETGIRLRT